MKNLMLQPAIVLIIMISLSSLSGNTLINNLGDKSNEEQMSQELTTLFRSARGVISANQKLINDASKGDKGLTGEKVITLTKANFKKTTGHELSKKESTTLIGQARIAMLDAIKKVMDDSQSWINEEGMGFKGFLPAIFAKAVADDFSKRMSGKMLIKLTAPKQYVRNRANRPDKWENNVIESKFKSPDWEKGKSYSESADHKGKPGIRYILPEYYKESCLSCHGDPKGERDITGGKKEGGKLGELGGAISFVIYE